MTSLRHCPQYGPVLLRSLELWFLTEMLSLPLNPLSNLPHLLPSTHLTRALARLQLILSMLRNLSLYRRHPSTPTARLPQVNHESSTTHFGLSWSSFLATAHLLYSN